MPRDNGTGLFDLRAARNWDMRSNDGELLGRAAVTLDSENQKDGNFKISSWARRGGERECPSGSEPDLQGATHDVGKLCAVLRKRGRIERLGLTKSGGG